MADKEVGLSLKVNGDQAEKAVKSFKSQLREAQNDLTSIVDKFGATSVEATKAAKRVAELRDAIGDAKDLAAAFNPDKKFEAFSGALRGVTGGFAALQGAIGLTGTESEDLNKQLLKVQSALALSEGLNSITSAKDSFKNLAAVIKTQVVSSFGSLKAAIISTGVGALVVGVLALVTNFGDLRDKLVNLIPGLGKVFDFFGKLVNKVTDFVGITSEAGRQLDKLTKQTDKQLKETERYLDLNADKYDQYTQKKFNADRDYQKKKLDFLKDDKLTEEQRNNFIAQAFAQRNRKIAEANKKRTDAFSKLQEAERKKAEEAFLKAQEEEKKRQDKIYSDELFFYERRKAARDGKKNTGVDITKGVANLTNEKIEQDKAEKERLKKNEEDYQEFLKKSSEKGLGAFLMAKAAETGKRIAAAEKQKEIDKGVLDNKKLLQQQEIDLIYTLSDIVGQQTVAGKALAVAAATINTYQAASEALKGNYGPFGPFAAVARVVAVASTIALGLKQVKSILSVQVPGASGGSVSAGSAASGGLSPVQSPLQPSISSRAIDQFNLDQQGNASSRAYVLDRDISNNQERERRLSRAAKLG